MQAPSGWQPTYEDTEDEEVDGEVELDSEHGDGDLVPELGAELDEKEELYGEGVDPFLELQDLCFEWVLQECQLTGACSSCQ